jgi:hypothetical protein
MEKIKNSKLKNFSANDILKPYKDIIQKSLYPKMGNSVSLSTGKSALQAYKKTANCADGTLELMMFYVECGNNFTVDFGDIDEQFYYNLETMFQKVVDQVKNSNQKVINNYLPRLKKVVKDADGIGWGYYDCIEESLKAAFPDL